jgi:hypothetical protein
MWKIVESKDRIRASIDTKHYYAYITDIYDDDEVQVFVGIRMGTSNSLGSFVLINESFSKKNFYNFYKVLKFASREASKLLLEQANSISSELNRLDKKYSYHEFHTNYTDNKY